MLSLQPVSYIQVFKHLGRTPGALGVGVETGATLLLSETGDTSEEDGAGTLSVSVGVMTGATLLLSGVGATSDEAGVVSTGVGVDETGAGTVSV